MIRHVRAVGRVIVLLGMALNIIHDVRPPFGSIASHGALFCFSSRPQHLRHVQRWSEERGMFKWCPGFFVNSL